MATTWASLVAAVSARLTSKTAFGGSRLPEYGSGPERMRILKCCANAGVTPGMKGNGMAMVRLRRERGGGGRTSAFEGRPRPNTPTTSVVT